MGGRRSGERETFEISTKALKSELEASILLDGTRLVRKRSRSSLPIPVKA